MALTFEIIESEDYLLCEVSGEHDTIQDYKEPISAVLRHCRNSRYTRAIIDYRLVTIYPEPSERIALLDDFSKLYSAYFNHGGEPVRLAFITSVESYDNNEIPMTVANHMGLDLIRTSDIEEAVAWLKKDNSSKQ